MRGGLQQQARPALSRRRCRTGVASFKDVLRRFQDQSCLGRRLVVAGQAVLLQYGENIPLEIDRSRALDFRNGNGFGMVVRGLGFGANEIRVDKKNQCKPKEKSNFGRRRL